MTRIEFVLLDTGADKASVYERVHHFANAAASNGGMFIHADDPADSYALSTLINPSAEYASAPSKALASITESAVVVGHGREPDGTHHTLLNLAPEVPWFFGRFERMIEVVQSDENARKSGRERYRYYKCRGYPLSHRQL